MTPKEAISYAAGMLKNGGNKQKQDFVKVVTKALEKQIPTKPKLAILGHYPDARMCPSCGTLVRIKMSDIVLDYCPYCSQAIDWSEE